MKKTLTKLDAFAIMHGDEILEIDLRETPIKRNYNATVLLKEAVNRERKRQGIDCPLEPDVRLVKVTCIVEVVE